MLRTIAAAALSLFTLFSPCPARAYPNSAAQYSLTIKDVSWTVLQDHRDQLRWYYLPAAASLSETGKRQPVLAILKYQVPDPANKQTLIKNTLVLLTLNLAPEKAVLDELAKGVAGLKPMLERKAAAKDIGLESVRLNEAKLILSGAGGQPLAEAAAIEAIGPGVPAAELSFYLKTEGETADMAEKLLMDTGGVKIAVDYAYTAGAPKAGAARPGPTIFRGQASGSVSLGAYPREVQDKSVVLFPYGNPQTAFFQLPAVPDSAGIKEVRYAISIVDPDGKESRLAPAESAMWSAKAGGWRDPRGNFRQTLLFPALALYDRAKAAGKEPSAYKLRVKGEVGVSRGAVLDLTKAEGDTDMFTGGIPFGPAYSPFRVVSVYGDFLTFLTQDSSSNLAAVQVTLSCGKLKENLILQADKDGKLKMNPGTAFFPKACGAVGMEVGYIEKGGKRNKKVFSGLAQGRDLALYLEDYTD